VFHEFALDDLLARTARLVDPNGETKILGETDLARPVRRARPLEQRLLVTGIGRYWNGSSGS